MTSPVDICNLALTSLGQPTVTAIDPPDTNSKSARLCAQLYPLMRDEMIRKHPWRRLKRRAQLAASVVAPLWGYTTKYPLPADCITLIEIYVGDDPLREWDVEGDFILCNETAALNIRYIATSTDPNEWDPLLINAIAYRLAVDLAEPLTGDPNKKSFAIAKYTEVIAEAKNASAQEGTPTELGQPDLWVSTRFGGTTDGLMYRGIS